MSYSDIEKDENGDEVRLAPLRNFISYVQNDDGGYFSDEHIRQITRLSENIIIAEYHKGFMFHRTEHNPRERAFYEAWLNENDRRAGINQGQGILQNLFFKPPSNLLFGGEMIEEINNRDRFIVATVIQWLGTNCGQGFLYDALGRVNLRIVEMNYPHRDEESIIAQRDSLQQFKNFVHRRLDEMGINPNPDGPHSKEGCRIGDRLDIVAKKLQDHKILNKSLQACIDKRRVAGQRPKPYVSGNGGTFEDVTPIDQAYNEGYHEGYEDGAGPGIQLGSRVNHIDVYGGKETFEVVGIRPNELELRGDWSGGTHNAIGTAWMQKDGWNAVQPQ